MPLASAHYFNDMRPRSAREDSPAFASIMRATCSSAVAGIAKPRLPETRRGCLARAECLPTASSRQCRAEARSRLLAVRSGSVTTIF